jgi:hypothetical protein
MRVTAIEMFLDSSGEYRGRICRRGDDLWVFVIERLAEETDEFQSYWINGEPSGLYPTRNGAVSALRIVFGEMMPIEGVLPVVFDTDVGPYPEP